MKRTNRFTQLKVQIRDFNNLIKDFKQLAKGATFSQQSEIMDNIIQARQSQMLLVAMGQKEYPDFNWLSLAVGQLKSGVINRNDLFNNLIKR